MEGYAGGTQTLVTSSKSGKASSTALVVECVSDACQPARLTMKNLITGGLTAHC